MIELNTTLQLSGPGATWSSAIAAQSGIRVASCYQCLRCSNSCPVSAFMDIKPHQVVRLVQLGQQERLLQCSSIWVCLSCEMCTTYCPNEIDVAGLMNHLKNLVVAGRRIPAELDISTFHEVFLSVLRKNGRINDLQLMQRYKWKRLMQGNLPPRDEVLRDLRLAIQLLKRNRLRLLPEKSPAAGEIRAIRQQLGFREDAS
jgi:heterodisulfide reductase subunit C2